jgi:hypothetical protein
MTKFCLTIFFAFIVAFSSANIVLCQTTNKPILNPPKWIFGSWNNLAESNTQKFEAFIFSANKIQFLSGFGEKSKTMNFAEKFSGYEVTETVQPKLYRVVFTKETSEYIYEFKFCSDCLMPTDQKALTYSVTENQKIVREHSKSANLLLIRYESCG